MPDDDRPQRLPEGRPTDDEIARWRALTDAATPGPWLLSGSAHPLCLGGVYEREGEVVERILTEPFTVRELVILSPYARERSAAGQALASPATDARLTSRLGTSIDDATRIRWGSIHEFKGLEAPAVILTDVDLSKEYHRDLLYVGASRATDRLVVFEQVS
jgi:hypothetical protein